MRIGNIFIKKLKAPVYGSPLWIVICPDTDKAIEKVEALTGWSIADDKTSISAHTFGAMEKGVMKFFVFLPPTATPGRIAHEASHLVHIIRHWVGCKPSYTNDEDECYYLEEIVDRIHRTIDQYKK